MFTNFVETRLKMYIILFIILLEQVVGSVYIPFVGITWLLTYYLII